MNKFSRLLTAMLLAGSAFSAANATSDREVASLDLADKWICVVVK